MLDERLLDNRLVLVLVLVIIASVYLLRYLWDARRFKRYTKVLGGSGFGLKATAVQEGIRCQYQYRQGSRNIRPAFTIKTPYLSDGAFKVTRRTRPEMPLDSSFLFREIQTHDPFFDRDYFIQASRDEFLPAVFQAHETREALIAVFACGVSAIEYDGEAIEAKWSPFNFKECDPGFIRKSVPHLVTVAKQIPVLATSAKAVGLPGRKRDIRRTLLAAPLCLLVAGLLVSAIDLKFYLVSDTGSLFNSLDDSFIFSLECGLLAAGLYMSLAWLLLQDQPSTNKGWRELFMVAFFCLPLSGMILFPALNVWLDFSSETAHTVRAYKKFVHSSHAIRRQVITEYKVWLVSWRQLDSAEEINISPVDYARVKPGETQITVITKPGLFGYEWAVRYRIE